jgi:hypothetical protein
MDLRFPLPCGKLWVSQDPENKVCDRNKILRVRFCSTNPERVCDIFPRFSLRESGPNILPKLIENPTVVIRSPVNPRRLNLPGTASAAFPRKRVKRNFGPFSRLFVLVDLCGSY